MSTNDQPPFGIIKAVSGWGVRWGTFRHQNGSGLSPSGPGPFTFQLPIGAAWSGGRVQFHFSSTMVDGVLPSGAIAPDGVARMLSSKIVFERLFNAANWEENR